MGIFFLLNKITKWNAHFLILIKRRSRAKCSTSDVEHPLDSSQTILGRGALPQPGNQLLDGDSHHHREAHRDLPRSYEEQSRPPRDGLDAATQIPTSCFHPTSPPARSGLKFFSQSTDHSPTIGK